MKLSIITVNYNHKYFPRLSIEALERSKTDFDFEIIFVDNASTDPISLGFLQQASREGRIKFIRSEKNLGFAGGNNLGVKHAGGDGVGGEYLFFLNPDTAVFEDTLQKMVDYIQSHPDTGILGAQLVYADGTVQESCRRDMRFLDLIVKRTPLRKFPWGKTRLENYLMGDFDHEKTQPVELITGAAMMMRRDLFERIGGFDERYFLFMEDFDLCKKVRAVGAEKYKIIYFPEARIHHYHKRLSDGNAALLLAKKVFWLHLSSAAKYFWKWRSRV